MFRRLLARLVANCTLCFVCCSTFAAAQPIYLINLHGQDYVFDEELSDEFNSPLSSLKWMTSFPGWGGRPPGRFSDRNVVSSDGMLQISTVKENYESGILRSLKNFKYGIVEARLLIGRSKASSALWLVNHSSNPISEIDIIEACGDAACGGKIHTNIHSGHQRLSGSSWRYQISRPKSFTLGPTHATGFTVLRLEWTKKDITWLIDGVEVRREANDHWHQPLHLIIDSEIMVEWFGLPTPDTLPSRFLVDYVRTWTQN